MTTALNMVLNFLGINKKEKPKRITKDYILKSFGLTEKEPKKNKLKYWDNNNLTLANESVEINIEKWKSQRKEQAWRRDIWENRYKWD